MMRLRWIWVLPLLLVACATPGPVGQISALLSPHAARLAQIIALTEGRDSAVDGGRIGVVPDNVPVRADWRQAEAQLYLSPAGPMSPNAEFLFPGQQAEFTRLVLNSLAPRTMDARISCNATAQLYGASAHSLIVRAGRARAFVLPAESGDEIYLKIGPEVTECTLSWGEGRQMRLRREAMVRPDLAQLDSHEATCMPPDPAGMDALQAAFHADRWLSQTCARPTGETRHVQRPLDALNARIEALTGARVSEARLRAGNPDMALDFSNAPDLELIYLSYLFVRADFSGALMARMLEWHAERGTMVRLLLTDILMRGPDRALFERLAAAHPNVQLQYFKWTTPGLKTPAELVDLVQRIHHIKAFATLSSQPGRSRFIIGGRNIWDGFFFDQPLDLSAHPELRTYDLTSAQGLTYYSTYEDFEIELRGDAIVRDFAAHLSTYWHRDMRRQVIRPMVVHGAAGGPVQDGVARHFMSFPWADALAQETYFVELLDAARQEIVLVTPFMYPTPAIVNALLRARARGVRVVVVARINSTDPSGAFITALNRGFVARWAGAFEVYEYVPGERMMHTKLILIDGRLAVVTSTNLNRRSFLHDTENGVVFLDRAVTRRLRGVVDSYLATATRQQPGQELEPFDRVMNQLTDIWQYF